MQIDESTLPPYLKKDIEALKAYHRGEPNPYHMGAGDLVAELYGSINGAQWDNEITKEVADFLRAKYMAYDNGVDVEYYFETHSIYDENGKRIK